MSENFNRQHAIAFFNFSKNQLSQVSNPKHGMGPYFWMAREQCIVCDGKNIEELHQSVMKQMKKVIKIEGNDVADFFHRYVIQVNLPLDKLNQFYKNKQFAEIFNHIVASREDRYSTADLTLKEGDFVLFDKEQFLKEYVGKVVDEEDEDVFPSCNLL